MSEFFGKVKQKVKVSYKTKMKVIKVEVEEKVIGYIKFDAL